MKNNREKIHYGWILAVTGTLCIFACLGLGRFAIGMLLPSMASSLNLAYDQMGLIGTINFVGYLIAVLFCGQLTQKFSNRAVIFFALLLIGLSMISISFAANYEVVLALYFITGLGSGAANVPMMALVSSWFTKKKRGRAAGLIVIGSGFAILFTGYLVPLVNEEQPITGWQTSWLILGIIVLVVAVICGLVLRDRPADLGLHPVGDSSPEPPLRTDRDYKHSFRLNRFNIYHLGAVYFIFGFVYSSYVTFIVTALVEDDGFSEKFAGNLWSWIGFFSLFSGPVFGSVSDRFGHKTALILVYLIHMLSYLFVAMPLPSVFIYLSVFLFGIVAWSIPSIMAALVGDYVEPHLAAKMFGLITFIFAFGQISGPAVTGYLAELTQSFNFSFYIIAAFAGLAVVLSVLLRKPRDFS